MKKTALTLVTLCALTLTAFGGWSWVTINGELCSVWTSDNGRWITIDGPNGFHADGYRWGNGNID
jgi:hypothetical protein